jgi:hypothetical protein
MVLLSGTIESARPGVHEIRRPSGVTAELAASLFPSPVSVPRISLAVSPSMSEWAGASPIPMGPKRGRS